MPVSPSCVSGISVSHFRNCRSFDELWIFRVGPATLKDLTGRKSETQALPPRCRHAHSFRILSWNSASRPRFFFHHIVAQVRASIWHFENSSPLLWNPRYSEKGDLPEHFASTFLLLCHFHHDLTDYLLAVFYRQSPSCEMIDKSQGDLKFFQQQFFHSVPSLVDFNCAIIFRSFHFDFLCANLAELIISYRLLSNLQSAVVWSILEIAVLRLPRLVSIV